MSKLGAQTWEFQRPPVLISTGTVAGKLESEGPIGHLFDVKHSSDRVENLTWEQSEQVFFQEAVHVALQKANLLPQQVDVMVGGDLSAQLTSSYLGLKQFSVPILGVYSACASICESLFLASFLVENGFAKVAVAGTSSHTSAAERQFRYPTEYGVQKPPTAQRTVTGSGVAILGDSPAAALPIRITHATVGKVMDYGISNPWEMGAAMAPAAAHTLTTHFKDTGRSPADYDCIATGDLGHIGHQILRKLLADEGYTHLTQLTDCGILIFDPNQPEVFSGGSGGACCSLVTFSHLIDRMIDGQYKRLLISATGALLSTISAQQHETIPGISHAIAFERIEEEELK
ncbi:stage V sporulation protein AD [Alicyclobacillus tolerans]|uniref:stage V sporulation protein AD n=1 Tax=Alicyclobacillus tolerans TaxID=90970 RepID=UPI003B7F6DAD